MARSELEDRCRGLDGTLATRVKENWIGLCSVLRPRQHSIGYMEDGFYRSKDPTNSIKVLKEDMTRTVTQVQTALTL